MKPRKTRTVTTVKKSLLIDRAKLIRAVASSTAIETREPIDVIEGRLKSDTRRFKQLKLA